LARPDVCAFASLGRGLDSVEGKTNSSGLRFLVQAGAEGNQGRLSWNGDQIPALIEWEDEVVHHALRQRNKCVRLMGAGAAGCSDI
jgi:hypothetical protein